MEALSTTMAAAVIVELLGMAWLTRVVLRWT